MRYLSVCSGIEAATVAWHPLGWTPIAFSEIEKFPSAVLAHHYPDTPNRGDMTQHEHWPIGPGSVDLLVGGTPCQSFSVAGLRKGLADPRGNLALTYLSIADRLRPRWLVWENVPGVLSSSGGRDFGAFLGALAELGYGFAYRVLDAQWFGVAQRRRRVFLVGHLGDWRRAAAVLFERESLRGDPAPSREAREAVASDAQAGARGSVVYGGSNSECSDTVTSKWSKGSGGPAGNECGLYVAHAVPYDLFQITAPVNRQNRKPGDPCHTLARDNAAHAAVAFDWQSGGDLRGLDPPPTAQLQRCQVPAVATGVFFAGQGAKAGSIAYDTDIAPTLKASDSGTNRTPSAHIGMAVRRLTPVECERLQGFPDHYTAIPWRGKPAAECPDGPRYRALGNSMAVPCMRWIGERIAQVDAIPQPM